MKRIKHLAIIATVVLGVGTMASASANQSSIDDSIKAAMVQQSQKVTLQVSQQISESIAANVQKLAPTAAQTKLSQLTKVAKLNTTTSKPHLSTED
jgi:3-hydroxyacyl-CoA dehydrogenase